MTKGAMAILSSPGIESFGLRGSFSLTSVTPASDVSRRSKAKTTMEMRFMRHLPAELAAAWAAVTAAWAAGGRSASHLAVLRQRALPIPRADRADHCR